MIKDSIEYLIKIATNPPYSNNLLAARQEYQKYAGGIFDDDKSYENQMALFLEWYIFDRIEPAHGQTVLELIINDGKGETLDPLKNINEFISHIHGLFIIKKIKDHSIKAINLFDNEQYNVVEPSGKLYFSKNSIFPGYNALIPCLITSLLLLVSGNLKYFKHLFLNSFLIYIGKISYSLYLFHWPLLIFYKYITVQPLSFFERECGALSVPRKNLEFPLVAAPKTAKRSSSSLRTGKQ